MMRSVGALALVAVTGCNSIQVYKSETAWESIAGVPFYVKAPVEVQETKRLTRELVVVMEVRQTVDGRTSITPIPATGLRLPPEAADALNLHLSELRGEAAKKDKSYADMVRLANGKLEHLRLLAKAAPTEEVVSNTRSAVAVLTTERLYINTRQPLIGSASGTYKLSSEGTLTEASATVTDETVKTLLSLIPISAKISEEWGISASTTKTEKTGPAAQQIEFNATVSEVRTLYTLRKMRPCELGKDCSLKPLDLNKGRTGRDGVELVSVEILSADAPPKADNSSFKVQGTVTPPKPN